jgi:SnoaL-like polyketide cyclase
VVVRKGAGRSGAAGRQVEVLVARTQQGHARTGEADGGDQQADTHLDVDDGDLVVAYGIISGTNTGEMRGQAATRKHSAFAYTDMHRVDNGRIVES